MKRHRHYRVGLLIGLLTLSTLSACVNTREGLGVRNNRYESNCTASNIRRMWYGLSPRDKVTYLLLTTMSLCFVSGGCIYHYFTSPSNVLGPSMNNGTNLTTLSPLTSTEWSTTTVPYNSTTLDELQEHVTNAIEDGEKKWGNGSSTEAPLSSTTKRPSSTTTEKPNDGVPPIVDVDKVFSDLVYTQENNICSLTVENMKSFLDAAGIDIKARDSRGDTILMNVAPIQCENQDIALLLQFIIDQGVDVNAENHKGSTVLKGAIRQLRPGLINFLLKNGVDPVKKNSDDKDALSFARRYQREKLPKDETLSSIIEQLKAAVK